ncbi:hypothetical protein HU200_034839 [Digitaria exilis]|uniref:Purple acid phosphatase n=1 Tax=Digitaria exilis TaxID=1010633 RepID=A0A835BT99_9POAL|nr:hypothetical protein HU200_034839 [Digitaria exilis]
MHPGNPHLPFLLFLAVAIKIRWSGLPAPDGLDHVAIYSPPSSRDRDFLGYLFLNGSASWHDGHGELSLPRLPTLRAPYQFRLFRWPASEYSYNHIDHDQNPLPHGKHRVAVSGDVSVGDPACPEQVHLAFTDAVDEMRVMFLCGDDGKRVVRYGLEEKETNWTEVGTEVSTYERKHMCDKPANHSVGWRDPGFVFDGLMKGLLPGRRRIQKKDNIWAIVSKAVILKIQFVKEISEMVKVGSDTGGWSKTYNFISRDSEANETIAFLFGDMGTYVPYNTYIRTQAESLSTIEPIAANTPYHVCIGNHEYDWPSQPWKPSWATYGKDGGGECGIPYSVKFRMPGNSILPTGNGGPDTRNLYYSFDSGVVHFVYMSTETNFLQGSEQYNFLKSDLEKVNRTRTPFIVFQGHRPMYTSSDETRDAALKQQMLQHLEPLLVTYNVTLALWGHVHRYERFCPMKNFQCVNTSSSFQFPGAPAHPERSMFRGGVFGYTRLVATKEKLTLTYVGNHDGQVHDMVEIFSGQVSNNSSVAEAVDGTKLSTGVSTVRRKYPLYLEIGGSVIFALLLGFGFGFLVRRKKEAAQWTPVKNEES